MTRRWLAVRLLAGYSPDVLGITDIEVQKLAYFLGVRRPALQLRFAKGPYGPYCDLITSCGGTKGHYLQWLRRPQPSSLGTRSPRSRSRCGGGC